MAYKTVQYRDTLSHPCCSGWCMTCGWHCKNVWHNRYACFICDMGPHKMLAAVFGKKHEHSRVPLIDSHWRDGEE